MIICDFCVNYRKDGRCELGLNIPKAMSCREFGPSIAGFCSNPTDFVSPRQIIEMATFFGLKRTELKKVKLMATQEETSRVIANSAELSSLPVLPK